MYEAISRIVPRECMRIEARPGPRDDTRRAPGSSRRPETSLIAAAPASSAARATSAFTVSTESSSVGCRRTSASTTGSTRASSTVLGTGSSRPGRVDSPPTSSIAAPGLEQRVGLRQRRVERR